MGSLIDALAGTEDLYERIIGDPAQVLRVLVAVSEECAKNCGPPRNGMLTPHEFAEVVVRVTGHRARRTIAPFTSLARAMEKMGLLESRDGLMTVGRKEKVTFFTISRLGKMLGELASSSDRSLSAVTHLSTLLERNFPKYHPVARQSGSS